MPVSKKQKQKLEALGKKVKAIRKSKDLTMKQLGDLVGKEWQSVQRLESGGVNPSFLYLLDVCKGLNIDVTELLDGFSE